MVNAEASGLVSPDGRELRMNVCTPRELREGPQGSRGRVPCELRLAVDVPDQLDLGDPLGLNVSEL